MSYEPVPVTDTDSEFVQLLVRKCTHTALFPAHGVRTTQNLANVEDGGFSFLVQSVIRQRQLLACRLALVLSTPATITITARVVVSSNAETRRPPGRTPPTD